MDKTPITGQKGSLFIVATPIGNMNDLTLRAMAVLREADVIAAEDTRRTGKLLAFHSIPRARGSFISYEEHNEERRCGELIRRMNDGQSVALVTDAGTPSVSDPGYRLVNSAIAAGVPVVPIPGASAVMTALSASGLPTDAFTFVGFVSKKKDKRVAQLNALAFEERTLVFYESPKRVLVLIEDIINIMGDRHGVLSREMTKRHEEFIRDGLTRMLAELSGRPTLKGECTLLVSGYRRNEDAAFALARDDIRQALETEGRRLSDTVKQVADTHELPRNRVYQEALKIRDELRETDR